MKHSVAKGIGFGLTSGVITTLGLLVGLYSGTHSMIVVLGGILTIAVADGMSDALGIHISEEIIKKNSCKQVWESTIATFFTKLLFALTFAIPVIFLPLDTAIAVSVAWGILLIGILSYRIAKKKKTSVAKAMAEHIGIAIVVVILTYLLGLWVSTLG